MRVFLSRLIGAFRRRDADLDEEIQTHLELLTEENIKQGMARDQARAAARRAFGGVAQTKEAHGDQHGFRLVEDFLHDTRFGLRFLRKSPGFAFTAVATLTLGIGVNVLIFSFAYPILTTRLPGTESERLVRIFENRDSNVFYADYEAFRDQTRVLEDLAASQIEGLSLRIGDVPEHLVGMVVSGNYFHVLGISAQLGRTLTPNDDRPDAPGVVVLTDRSWRTRFGADPGIVGRPVVVNGRPYTVVGVAPPRFLGTAVPVIPEMWVAWHAPGFAPSAEDVVRRRERSAQVIGRLKPGQTLQDAQQDLAHIAADLATTYPENHGRTVNLYEGYLVAPALRAQTLGFLTVLLTLTALVLIVACVNLAGLQLARGAARVQEIGIRLALGAGRGRLVRQLLTESLLLSVLSSIAAVVSVVAVGRALASWSAVMPGGMTLTVAPEIGWNIVASAMALAVATTVLVGLLPALRSSRIGIVGASYWTTSTGSRLRGQAFIVAAQLCLTTVLIVLAAVLARSLAKAQALDPGFSSDGVLSASIDVSSRSFSPEPGARFYADLRESVEQVPGVISVGLAELVPLTLSGRSRLVLKEGQNPPARTDRESVVVFTNNVSPGFLDTLGIPLRGGRDFEDRDRVGQPDVAIINETMARRYWADTNPLARRFRIWDGLEGFGPWIEVVGIVHDGKYVTLGEEPRPFFYRPLGQSFAPDVTLLIKTAREPLRLLPTLRTQLRTFDPDLAVFSAAALTDQTKLSVLPVRLAASVAMVLGLIVLVLAAIGIYGVTAYQMRRRTREVGLRIALGAEPSRIVALLTRRSLRWTAGGIGCGLVLAAFAAAILRTLLYGVSAVDPVAFGGVAFLLGTTAYAAAYIPARRVSRLDPMVALRCE
jgi:putative ABC transport system permease protein